MDHWVCVLPFFIFTAHMIKNIVDFMFSICIIEVSAYKHEVNC